MTLDEFVDLAKEFKGLGDAVGEQLEDIVAGQKLNAQNPNALKMISDRLLRDLVRSDDEELAEDARALMGEIDTHLAKNKDPEEQEAEEVARA